MQEDNYNLEFDAFLRSFGLSKSGKYAFLLGAGCSISSGLPSAQQCIWDWKKEIFRTNNKINAPIFDVRQESVQKIIQNWLDNTGQFPSLNSDNEYEYYIERTFPIEADRKEYFAQLSRKAKPAIGYKLLIELFKYGKIASIWSTNFDGLVEKAAIKGDVSCVNVNINTADLIYSQPYSEDLLYVVLHGDYKYTKLKNTTTELDAQDTIFEQSLANHLSANSLIVIGYSGRDKSLMRALKNAFSKPGCGRLFWLGYGGMLPESVKELICYCRNNNREAYFINSMGFDEVMLSIMEHCFNDDPSKRAHIESIKNQSIVPLNNGTTIPLKTGSIFNSKLKLNLYPFRASKSYYQIDTTKLSSHVVENINEIIKNSSLVFSLSGTQIYAFASITQLVETFSINSPDIIEKVQMPSAPLSNGVLKNLLIKSVLYGLSRGKSHLHISYRDKIIWNHLKRYNGLGYEGVKINLYKIQSGNYLLVSFSPTIFFIKEENISKEQKQNITRKYIDSLRNREFYNKISEWESDFFGGQNLIWKIPENESNGCTFSLGQNSAYGGVFDYESTEPKFTLTNREIWSGKRLAEPKLLFADTANKTFIEDENPMRGLCAGQPLDQTLNMNINSPIYLGVICPISHSRKLYNFLTKLNSPCNPKYFD